MHTQLLQVQRQGLQPAAGAVGRHRIAPANGPRAPPQHPALAKQARYTTQVAAAQRSMEDELLAEELQAQVAAAKQVVVKVSVHRDAVVGVGVWEEGISTRLACAHPPPPLPTHTHTQTHRMTHDVPTTPKTNNSLSTRSARRWKGWSSGRRRRRRGGCGRTGTRRGCIGSRSVRGWGGCYLLVWGRE